MRLPIAPSPSTKDGVANKNARMFNMLREKDKAVLRPGLSLRSDYAGVGNGLIPFDGRLLRIQDDTIYVDDGGAAPASTSGTSADLSTVDGTPIPLTLPAWNSGYTYPLDDWVSHGGTNYTSLCAGNVGNTPGSSSCWATGPVTIYDGTLTAALIVFDPPTSATVYGYWSTTGGSGGSYSGAVGAASVAILESQTVPDAPATNGTVVTLSGARAAGFFQFMTVGATVFFSASADYAADYPDVGYTTWSWAGTNAITGTGSYAVSFAVPA